MGRTRRIRYKKKPRSKTKLKEIEDGRIIYEEEYVPGAVIDHKKQDEQDFYLVHWKSWGWEDKYLTWEPTEHLQNHKDLIDNYFKKISQDPHYFLKLRAVKIFYKISRHSKDYIRSKFSQNEFYKIGRKIVLLRRIRRLEKKFKVNDWNFLKNKGKIVLKRKGDFRLNDIPESLQFLTSKRIKGTENFIYLFLVNWKQPEKGEQILASKYNHIELSIWSPHLLVQWYENEIDFEKLKHEYAQEVRGLAEQYGFEDLKLN